MKRPADTVTVGNHALAVCPPGAMPEFGPPWKGDALVMVSTTRDSFIVMTMIADGLVVVTGSGQDPDSGEWDEHQTFQLEITQPLLVLQVVDEDELDPVFVPVRPGSHTVTAYARNRDPKKADTVQRSEKFDDLEQYLLVFTPNT